VIPFLKTERTAIGEIAFCEKMTIDEKLLLIEKRAEFFQQFLDFSDISEQNFTFNEDFEEKESFLTKERFEKYKKTLLSLAPMNEDFPNRCKKIKTSVFNKEYACFFIFQKILSLVC
jgi:hypothetical protein